MEEKLTPTEFLKDFGIEMEKTTLICYIDGVMKQPSLSFIMQEYAKYVLDYSKRNKEE
jgi:hypothetical protein